MAGPEVVSPAGGQFAVDAEGEKAKIPSVTPPSVSDSVRVYLDLEKANAWMELARRAEADMESKGEERIPAKIFWVKAQHVLGVVPASVLAGPLDAATKELEQAGNFAVDRDTYVVTTNVAVEMLTMIGELLRERGSAELGVTLFERAYALDPTVGGEFAAMLEAEIERIQNNPKLRLDPKCQNRVAKYKKLAGTLTRASGHVSVVREGEPHPVPGTDGEARRTGRKGRGLMRVSACVIAALVITYFQQEKIRAYLHLQEVDLISVERSIEPGVSVAMRFPGVERMSSQGQLASLLGDIEKIPVPERPVTEAVLKQESPRQEMAQQPPAADPQQPPPARLEPLRRGKESIDTSGPRQRDDFPDRSERPEVLDEQIPAIDFPPFRNSRREPPPYDYDRGRTPPPPSSLPPPAGQDTFSEGRIFTAVARTKILRSASYYSESIGNLEIGDRVLVAGRDGKWLKLRSRKGQVGYVLAQDLEEGTVY